MLLLAHLFPAHVLAGGAAAAHVAQGLRKEGPTVRKRLLKTLLWVVNSGDFNAVYDAVAQVEDAVGELVGEEGAIGELASDLLSTLQQGGLEGMEDEAEGGAEQVVGEEDGEFPDDEYAGDEFDDS